MIDRTDAPKPASRGVLGRLRRDVRGNTLAMMAIALVPVAALAGSGVDTARLYVVKVRLQQACDAGVLAGRKFLADSNATAIDTDAAAQAQTFFANNFRGGYMKTGTPTFTPTKTADNQVAGTASVTVPMTVMKMFASNDVTLNVTCEARYDVADADVMFVLDTTGSMACTTGGACTGQISSYTRPDGTTGYYAVEASGSKIAGLRSAVMSFYDTLMGNVDPSTHVRYGFVTYTSTVNTGKAVYAVSPTSLVSQWNYNSRRVVGDYKQGLPQGYGPYYGVSSALCASYNGLRTPTTGYTTSGTATSYTTTWSPAFGGTCSGQGQTLTPMWRYESLPLDVSGYVAGNDVIDPTKVTGATSKWQGCLEERDTTATGSFSANGLPADLDPDLPATSDATRWRPLWPDVVYYRGNATSVDYAGNSSNPYGDTTSTNQQGQYTNLMIYNNAAYGYVSCGKPAQRLAPLSRNDLYNYVNASDFKAQGGTYHDVGMIWGTRMISPTGMFAADTAPWPGRQAPNRYIVFMTDGDMAPNTSIYGTYGMEQYDKRVTGGAFGSDTDYHNARFVAECAAAKARNITVFVVGFGQTLTTQLTQCASPGQAYYASDNASLTKAFQSIANQVAMLRVSK